MDAFNSAVPCLYFRAKIVKLQKYWEEELESGRMGKKAHTSVIVMAKLVNYLEWFGRLLILIVSII